MSDRWLQLLSGPPRMEILEPYLLPYSAALLLFYYLLSAEPEDQTVDIDRLHKLVQTWRERAEALRNRSLDVNIATHEAEAERIEQCMTELEELLAEGEQMK